MSLNESSDRNRPADSLQPPGVAIVGEINPDIILEGLPRDLAEGRELLASSCTLTLGGSSAILAHNLALLGTAVTFSARVGDDGFADMCLRELVRAGVNLDRVVRASGGSGTGVTVILPLAETRRILTFPGAMFELCLADLDLDFIARAAHFHLSSLFLHRKLFPDIPWLFQQMKLRGLTTSLDTNDDPEDRWQGVVEHILPNVDILFATEEELRGIAGVEQAEAFIAPRVPLLVVKRGARGASAFFAGRRYDSPALRLHAVDAVGAGDTFDAGFLHRWLRRAPLEQCLAYGNVAGGLSVTRAGGTAAFRDLAHRQSFFERHWQGGVLAPWR
ncbi:MAG: carbohydrate kinase family protein [Terracidiphilus sp.]|nr:carbohydrate kinase family protein [Terracidiphilus sp.]